MANVLHGSTRTTPCPRAEFQASRESTRFLAALGWGLIQVHSEMVATSATPEDSSERGDRIGLRCVASL